MAGIPKPPKPHARLEKWIWILIYGGLFAIILGLATGRADESIGWSLAVPGGLGVIAGVVLIFVRAGLGEARP